MATCLVTPRDIDILRALERSPLTVRQLLKLSETFAYPFTTERRAQERLRQLCAAGRLRRWFYATARQAAVSYFTLTPAGFQILHGPDARLPSRSCFGPVGIARQRHAHSLAEFLVHLIVATHRAQITIGHFHRENALCLRVGDETLYPDGAFELSAPGSGPFRFFVEMDNNSEKIRGTFSLDTWQRKIAIYERHQNACPERFRVLAVTTAGNERVANILDCARALARNPRRSLVYGITLTAFLPESEPLQIPCFRDHVGRDVSLLPPLPIGLPVSLDYSVSTGAAALKVVSSAPCLEPIPQA